jgi:hypothetical protein
MLAAGAGAGAAKLRECLRRVPGAGAAPEAATLGGRYKGRFGDGAAPGWAGGDGRSGDGAGAGCAGGGDGG